MTQNLTTPSASQELVLPDFGSADFTSQATFDELVKSSFMPRIQLMSGMSGLVTEGKMNVGKYAFIRGKEDFIDFQEGFICVPLTHRFAAMRFANSGGNEKFECYYDPNSAEFKQVQADSEQPNSGCSYGPQFLLWVPQVREYATYLFGSKSARPEARKLALLRGKGASFKAKLVTNAANQKWHVPVVLPYSGQFELPDIDAARAVAEIFNHPKPSEVITEPETPAAAGSTERVR